MKWNKSTSTVPLVGNDVVDLNEPATRGKASQPRFLQRVCTAQERHFIQAASQPEIALWMLWSAKETAYKIAKRKRPEILFEKKKFVVQTPDLILEESLLQGQVMYADAAIPVRWQRDAAFIHCTGYWPGVVTGFSKIDVAVARLDDRALDDIPLEEQELQSAHNLSSRRVRQLAKRLLAKQGLTGVQIVREHIDGQWKAPRIWQQGHPIEAHALSLSHHGQYVAVAVCVMPAGM